MIKLFNKLIGKDDRFFSLLESAAEEAHNSAQILEQLYDEVSGTSEFEKTLENLNISRKKEKKTDARYFRASLHNVFHAD